LKAYDSSLPAILPDEDINVYKNTKTYNLTKIIGLLPKDYTWKQPCLAVEPVSRGIPSAGIHHSDVDGNNHDRMWRVMKDNVRGKWKGDVKT